jgi:hypothetical protein
MMDVPPEIFSPAFARPAAAGLRGMVQILRLSLMLSSG